MLKENHLYIAEKIRRQRKRLQYTQAQLAEKVGLTEKQISRIEKGTNYPTLDNFFKIVEVLNLKLQDFSQEAAKDSITKEELLSIINRTDETTLKKYLSVLKALIN